MRIGQPVRIRLTQKATEFYDSRVVESNISECCIDIPLHHRERRALNLALGATVWVEYQAHDGALCSFQAQFFEVKRIPNVVWRISRPSAKDIIREQRREFVRVPADIQVRLEYIADGLAKHEDVYTHDISGGGMALYLPRHVFLRPGLIVDTKFTLPNVNFPVDVKSVVIRVSDRNDQGFAIGSFQFMNIKESVRQRVIQYTFHRQRTLLGQ